MSDGSAAPNVLETKYQKNWRPAIGWSVAVSLFFALVLLHLINVTLKILYWHPGDPVPQIDKPDPMLLLNAAGIAAAIGGFRTWEKINGVAGGPPQP